METDDVPRLVREREVDLAGGLNDDDSETLTPSAHDQASNVQKMLPGQQRLQIGYSSEELRALSADQKTQHFRDGIFGAIEQTIIEGTIGQPPMVDRFRFVMTTVEALESAGVPFGVGRNSMMNKELLKSLNQEARQSGDSRKSRQKQITADAVRQVLRQVKAIRRLGDHFIKLPPYT
jgi:hypothetical protein